LLSKTDLTGHLCRKTNTLEPQKPNPCRLSPPLTSLKYSPEQAAVPCARHLLRYINQQTDVELLTANGDWHMHLWSQCHPPSFASFSAHSLAFTQQFCKYVLGTSAQVWGVWRMAFNQLSDIEHRHLDVLTEFLGPCQGIHSSETTTSQVASHSETSNPVQMKNGSDLRPLQEHMKWMPQSHNNCAARGLSRPFTSLKYSPQKGAISYWWHLFGFINQRTQKEPLSGVGEWHLHLWSQCQPRQGVLRGLHQLSRVEHQLIFLGTFTRLSCWKSHPTN